MHPPVAVTTVSPMAERVTRTRRSARRDAPTTDTTAAEAATVSGEKLKADLDDLLDEIDDVLETNAEEFVKSYVQKGGQ